MNNDKHARLLHVTAAMSYHVPLMLCHVLSVIIHVYVKLDYNHCSYMYDVGSFTMFTGQDILKRCTLFQVSQPIAYPKELRELCICTPTMGRHIKLGYTNRTPKL